MDITKNSIVGEIVSQNYKTATVFKSHNIDFCCNGNRSIEQVCTEHIIESDSLITELDNVMKQKRDILPDFQSWDIDLLSEYIQKKHHRYVEQKIPELTALLNKIVRVHGQNHPELEKIQQLFSASNKELLQHMKKEERILFPYVRALQESQNEQIDGIKRPFGTINNPIEVMMHEHDNEGERFRKIAELSNNYTPPGDACTTYRVAFSMLKEFEDDLHLHIHLENNILFPKAIQAERRMKYA